MAVAILLVLGLAAQLLACFGVAAMTNAYDRLHYTGPSMLAAVALALAILVREGFSLVADKGLTLVAVVVVTSPVIVQAIARAARVAEHDGHLDAAASDVERAA